MWYFEYELSLKLHYVDDTMKEFIAKSSWCLPKIETLTKDKDDLKETIHFQQNRHADKESSASLSKK